MTEDSLNCDIVAITSRNINYLANDNLMIILKVLTPLIKYEKIKQNEHFFNMLTAAASHDMITPLNSIIGLL